MMKQLDVFDYVLGWLAMKAAMLYVFNGTDAELNSFNTGTACALLGSYLASKARLYF